MSAATQGGSRRRRTSGGRPPIMSVPPIGRLVISEVILVIVCLAALLGGLSLGVTTVVASVVTLLLVLNYGGRPLFDWITTTFRYAADRSPHSGATTLEVDSSGVRIGVHWNGNRVTCVAAVSPPKGSTTLLGRSRADVAETLPISALASCMTQHDIVLAGIDIISLGARSGSGTPATEVYERLIGPLPAVATRSVWIAVSLDVHDNTDAVAARGGGRTGIINTVVIATARVVRAVRAAGLDAEVLSDNDIHAAASAITRGVSPDRLTQTWRSAPLPGAENVGYGIDYAAMTNETLAELWAVPTLATSVALWIRPAGTEDGVRLGGSCRLTTRTRIDHVRLPGLISMRGRHRDALYTHLPFSDPTLDALADSRTVSRRHVDSLRIPTSGCGQLLGSDAAGNGIAARIFGTGIRSVLIASELYVAQQLMFRATAVGARVLVSTDRPHAWGSLVDSLASPAHMLIDGGPLRPDGRYDVVLLDYADSFAASPHHHGPGVTVVTLTEHLPRTPMPDPDLTIVQPGASGDRIRLRSSSGSIELILVTIPQETAFIGRPRSVRTPAPA